MTSIGGVSLSPTRRIDLAVLLSVAFLSESYGPISPAAANALQTGGKSE